MPEIFLFNSEVLKPHFFNFIKKFVCLSKVSSEENPNV